MKKTLLALIAFSFLFLTSCQFSTLKSKYFTVENGEYIDKKFPASTDENLTITDLDGNGYVIPGGAASISVVPGQNANYVLIGVEGENGYFKVPATVEDDGTIKIYLVISQDLKEENFVILVTLSNDGETAGIIYTINVETKEVGTGKLQVSLSWDQLNDIDLHLVQPDGEEIYYGHGESDEGGKLDLDSNPDCNIDKVNNENIFYNDEATILEGTYTVRVDMYANCEVTENTNYTVVVHYDGELISTSEGSNPFNGSFQPGNEDAGGAGSGVTVMKFNIGNVKNAQKLYHFTYPGSADKTKNALSPQKLR